LSNSDSRDMTRPALQARTQSKSNWQLVSDRTSPSTRAARASRSISSRPKCRSSPGVRLGELRRRADGLQAVGRRRADGELHPHRAEVLRHHPGQVRVVLDHPDARGHAGNLPGPGVPARPRLTGCAGRPD
jgi:hypothetical protein